MGVDKPLVCSVLVLLLQTHCCFGQSKMLVPSQPVIVPVGSDITLRCELDPVKNIKDLVVEWARPDLKPPFIHIRRDGLDLLIDQNSQYQGRTRLSERGLQCGDMSLQLSRVRLSDGGTYRCFVPQMGTSGEVTLHVVSVSPVAVSLTKDHSGSPVLRCESRGWYPEPELVWLDSEGTVLTGERTEVQRGVSDETFSVSSRLSVEQSPGNTFTCRVRQQETRQSTESLITVKGEFLEACASCAVAWTLFGLGLCLVAASGAFVLWKYKTQKSRTKLEDEAVPLMNEHREACSRITEELHFIEESEKLLGSKEFLLTLKEKLNHSYHELNSDIQVMQAQIKASFSKTSDVNKERDKQIQNNMNQMRTFRSLLELTDKELGKIDEFVKKSAERKGKLKTEYEQMNKLGENEKKCLEAAAKPEPQRVSKKDEVKVKVMDEMDMEDLCTQFAGTGIKTESPESSEQPTQAVQVREKQPEKREPEEQLEKRKAEEQSEKTEAEEGGSMSVDPALDSAVNTKKKHFPIGFINKFK